MDNNNFVISQSILKHSEIDMKIRSDYLKFASENRKTKNLSKPEYNDLLNNEEF